MTEREPESLQDLNLVDRFLFDQVMEAPGAYQTTINILLENKVTLLEKVQTEKELRIPSKLRAVRLDVVSMMQGESCNLCIPHLLLPQNRGGSNAK